MNSTILLIYKYHFLKLQHYQASAITATNKEDLFSMYTQAILYQQSRFV